MLSSGFPWHLAWTCPLQQGWGGAAYLLSSDLSPQHWDNDFPNQNTRERLLPFSSFMCIAFQPHSIIPLSLSCFPCTTWHYTDIACPGALQSWALSTLALARDTGWSQHSPLSLLQISSTSTDAHRCPNLAWGKAWDPPIWLQEPDWDGKFKMTIPADKKF